MVNEPRKLNNGRQAFVAAYEAGREARKESETYSNPHQPGSEESRKYYEGWCHQNLVVFLRTHRELL